MPTAGTGTGKMVDRVAFQPGRELDPNLASCSIIRPSLVAMAELGELPPEKVATTIFHIMICSDCKVLYVELCRERRRHSRDA